MSARPASRTLGDLLDEMAAARPHAQAIAFRHEQWSYAVLCARVDELAAAFPATGVTRGDRVAVLLPNRPEWVVAALAIVKIGGIVSAISTFSTARELGWMLEHSGAVTLITIPAFRGRGYLDMLDEICPELAASAPGALRSERLPSLRTVVSMDGRRVDGVFQREEFLALGAGVETAALRVRGAAGELRTRGGAGAARPRAVQRLLRHGEHGACHAGAPRSIKAAARFHAHRPDHRSGGLPLPGMDIRAADPETGRPLPAGEVGELCVAGHVTPGYFRAPELDFAAFDGEGYFHTGDLGLVGDDGRVRFPRPVEGDDQDRRHQCRAARGGGRAPPASGRQAGLRDRRSRP